MDILFLPLEKSSKKYSIGENQNLSYKFSFYNKVEAMFQILQHFEKKSK